MFKKPRFQSNDKILYALLIVYFKLLASPSLVNCLNNDTLGDLTDSQDNLEYSNKSISIELSGEEKERRFYNDLSTDMWYFFSPLLLAFGGIGNILCIIVLARKSRNNPTIVYLCLLAGMDMLVLFTGLLRNYVRQLVGFDMRSIGSHFCKVHIFLTYSFMHISAYILVAVTLNRFTIMFNRNIFCRQVFNTKKKSVAKVYKILGAITVAVFAMNAHFLIYYDIVKDEDKAIKRSDDCTITKENDSDYYWFRSKIFPKMQLFIFIIIPCVILCVLNILIINKLRQSKASYLNRKLSKLMKNKEEKKTTLSVMLVSVCLWFIILKTPASIYLAFPPTEITKVYFSFMYSMFMLIQYTNHAVNLILYISISETFRSEFRQFFLLCLRKLSLCKGQDESDYTMQQEVTTKRAGAASEKEVMMLENTV